MGQPLPFPVTRIRIRVCIQWQIVPGVDVPLGIVIPEPVGARRLDRFDDQTRAFEPQIHGLGETARIQQRLGDDDTPGISDLC